MPRKDGTGRLGRGKSCNSTAKSDRPGRGKGLGVRRGVGRGRK